MSSRDNAINLGFIAHIDAGKTTTTERVLFYTKAIKRMGEVHTGDTKTDFLQVERDRGITVQSAVISSFWRGCEFNIVDTPGHVDFTFEVEKAMKVLDFAVLLLDGVAGVEPQTIKVWGQASRQHVPIMCCVNKMDRLGASFEKCKRDIEFKLTEKVVVLSCPLNSEGEFDSILDVVDGKKYVWEKSGEYSIKDLNEEEYGVRQGYFSELVTFVLQEENELEMFERFMDLGEIDVSWLKDKMREYIGDRRIFPIVCMSALKNVGVQHVLDLIYCYAPRISSVADKNVSSCGSNMSVVFKLQQHPFLGRIAFVRVYEGRLRKNDNLYILDSKDKFRVMKVMKIQADDYTEIQEALAGEIVAISGFKDKVKTGSTLSDRRSAHPLKVIVPPKPVVEASIFIEDSKKLEEVIERIKEYEKEDGSFALSYNEDTSEYIISGMGELHLQIIKSIVYERYAVNFSIKPPKVRYIGSISKDIQINYKHKKQEGGRGEFAIIDLVFSPIDNCEHIEFENKIFGGVIPKEFVEAVKDGVYSAMHTGLAKLGIPVSGMRVSLMDGVTHEVDSSYLSFFTAAQAATRELFQKALLSDSMVIYEPYMKLEMRLPAEFIGNVSADIVNRRGAVLEVRSEDRLNVLFAEAPLAEMFSYNSTLKSQTRGMGDFFMSFLEFRRLPVYISQSKLKDALGS